MMEEMIGILHQSERQLIRNSKLQVLFTGVIWAKETVWSKIWSVKGLPKISTTKSWSWGRQSSTNGEVYNENDWAYESRDLTG